MANKHRTRCSIFLSLEGNARQNHSQIPLDTYGMAVTKGRAVTRAGEGVGKEVGGFSLIAGENVTWGSRFGQQSGSSSEV